MATNYKLLSEDENKFTLAYPDGTEFPVAKNALSDSVIERIREFGSESADPVRAPASQPIDPTPIPNAPTPGPIPGPIVLDDQGNLAAQTTSPTAAQSQEAAIRALQSQPAPASPSQAPRSPAAAPIDLAAGYPQMAAGIQATANAKAQEGREQEKIYQEQVNALPGMDALQKRQADIEARRAALQAETESLQKTVLEGKIDPNRMWNNMSTGNKVMATIGVLLSGLGGGGANGTPNLALKALDDAINRDIDAQKTELGKAQNLLSMNMRRFGDLDAAETATRLQMNTILQAKLSMTAARSGTAQAQAAAQLGLGQLKNQQAMLMAQLASLTQGAAEKAQIRQEASTLYSGQGAKSVSPTYLSDSERAKRVVFDPITGKNYGASSSEGAKTLNEALSSYKPLLEILARMKELGTTGKWTENAAEAKSLQAQFILAMRGMNPGLGVLSEGDKELLTDQAEDPNNWSQMFVRGSKTESTIKGMNEKIEAMKKQYIPNYRSPSEKYSYQPAGKR